jgi:hypothetical protein
MSIQQSTPITPYMVAWVPLEQYQMLQKENLDLRAKIEIFIQN